MEKGDNYIVISYKTILAVFLIGSMVWLAILIQSVIIAVFVSLVLALALEPIVDYFMSKKLPRGVSVFLVMAIFLTFVLGLGGLAVTPLIVQVRNLTQRLAVLIPQLVESVVNIPGFEHIQNQSNNFFADRFTETTGGIIDVTVGAFSGLVSAIAVIVFTMYILIDFDNLRTFFIKLFPKRRRKEIEDLMNNIEMSLGGWLRGQAILMLLIGIVTYFGLLLLGVPYPLALAVIAGLLEVIPILGPIISVIPAVIVAWSLV